ncbi:MAG: hypothetical protein JWN15_2910 [Firmicutes bacterium]|nr:hypothetical protein [Bacillota bacterium]
MVSDDCAQAWSAHSVELPPALAGLDRHLLQGIRLAVNAGVHCASVVMGSISGHAPVTIRVNGQCPKCPGDRFCPPCRKEIERSLRRLRNARRCVLIIFWSRLEEQSTAQAAGEFISDLLAELQVHQAVWLGPDVIKNFLRLTGLSLITPRKIDPPVWVGQSRRHPHS